jgi:hypothetical protein
MTVLAKYKWEALSLPFIVAVREELTISSIVVISIIVMIVIV